MFKRRLTSQKELLKLGAMASLFGSILFSLATVSFVHADELMAIKDSAVLDAALQSQMDGINALEGLLKKNRAGSKSAEKEKLFLLRLAEAYAQAAQFSFKLANSEALEKNKELNLKAYGVLLEGQARVSSEFLSKFSSTSDAIRVRYLRGKALAEHGRLPEALRDFSEVIDKMPSSKEAVASAIILNDIASQTGDYRKALQYLNKVRISENEDVYHLLLDKKVRAHLMLEEVSVAIQLFRKEKDRSQAQREDTLQLLATQYAKALRKKSSGHSVKEFVKLLKEFAPGEQAKPLIKLFAFNLASDSMEAELKELTHSMTEQTEVQITTTVRAQPATTQDLDNLDLLLFTLNHQLNENLFSSIPDTVKKIRSVTSGRKNFGDYLVRLKKNLQECASRYQKQIKSNVQKSESLAGLKDVYDVLLDLPETTEFETVQYRYNLGEAAAQTGDFEQAIKQLSAISSLKGLSKESQALQVETDIRIIEIQYQQFEKKNMVPKSIAAVKLVDGRSSAVEPELNAWISKIDTALQKENRAEKVTRLLAFRYEACRMLYARGQISRALHDLTDLVANHSKEEFSAGAAGLVVDTYVMSEKWDEIIQVIDQFLKIQWKDAEFKNKLVSTRSESEFLAIKKAQSEKRFDVVLVRAQAFLAQKHEKNTHLDELRAMSAQAALATGNRVLASNQFKILKETSANPEYRASAMLVSASEAEEQMNFKRAAQDYSEFFGILQTNPALAASHAKTNTAETRKKVIYEAWISGDRALLGSVLKNKAICTADLSQECGKYQFIYHQMAGFKEMDFSARLQLAQKSNDPMSGLWAASVVADVMPPDRKPILEKVSVEFEKADPMIQVCMIGAFTADMTRAFERFRAEAAKKYPLSLRKEAITARVNFMKAVEEIYTRYTTSGWGALRSEAFYQLAGLYYDFTREMKALPAPAGMTKQDLISFRNSLSDMSLPFEGKGKTFLEQSHRLPPSATSVHDAFLASIENEAIRNAVREKNFPLATYLLTQAKDSMSSEKLHLARAVLLSRAGAVPESMKELEQARVSMNAMTSDRKPSSASPKAKTNRKVNQK